MIVSMILTGLGGFSTAAGHIGPRFEVGHDISLLVPEIWCRLSAEEVSQALDGVRPFRRLAVLPKPLGDYDLQTVFVDPPRAGLDELTLQCVQRFDRILYISCNPETLLANLSALHPHYEIKALAFFDQFPYTPHLETGVLLQRPVD